MKRFQGRVAVITGAASGIGRALAENLAGRGCTLALVDVDADGLAQLAADLDGRGVEHSTHVVDVSDREAMEALPQAVIDAHGRVEILINNAGVSIGATLEEHSIEDLEWVIGINLWGVIYGCKFFLPHMRDVDDGYIVNLSSVFGLVGVPHQSSYCATKFAVRGFSESLGAELVDTAVRVLSVHPGGIATNIVKRAKYRGRSAKLRDPTLALFERTAMPPARAAEQIVRAMQRRQTRVLVTREAYVIDAFKRLVPAVPPTWMTWIRRRLLPQFEV